MYFLIPIKKKLTLLYIVNGRKLLLNENRRMFSSLIIKFIKNKLPENHEYFQLLASFLKESVCKTNARHLGNKIRYILDKRINANVIVNHIKLDDFICRYNSTSKICKFDILVGLIFDNVFLDKIERNKELLKDKWCLLVGLEDYYFFKLGCGICVKCLQLRRLTNLNNIRENIITEKYLNENRISVVLDNEVLALLNGLKFKNYSDKCVFIYDKNKNKLLNAKVIPLPGCSVCSYKHSIKITPQDSINKCVGILTPILTDTKKVGNAIFFVSTSSVSRINILSYSKINICRNNFSGASNYLNNKYSSAFSLFRPIICGGVSFINKQISETKAFGESLERYCAAYLDKEKLLKNNTFIFSREKDCPWVLYNTNQYDLPAFPFKKLSRKSDIYYVKGISLVNGNYRFVPASFVYIRYPLGISDIGIYPTSGLTCGTNIRRMRIDGICENVERDACMLTWLLRISPRKIINIKNAEILKILENFKIDGIEIQLFELSIDLKLPVILALGVNKKDTYPRVLIGSSCKPNKDAAIVKALEELTQGFSWKYLVERYKGYDFGKNFENITHFEHHALLYATLDNMNILNFLTNTDRFVEYIDINSELKYREVIDIFKNKFDIIEINLTTSDVGRMGYFVKKILLPGLQPLNSNHKLNFGDNRRIVEVKKYLIKNKINYDKKLNTFPHPFP